MKLEWEAKLQKVREEGSGAHKAALAAVTADRDSLQSRLQQLTAEADAAKRYVVGPPGNGVLAAVFVVPRSGCGDPPRVSPVSL